MESAKESAVKLASDIAQGKKIKEIKKSAQEELEKAKSKIATTLRGGNKRKKHLTGFQSQKICKL